MVPHFRCDRIYPRAQAFACNARPSVFPHNPMSPTDRALRLAALHVPGDPVILYNAWDAGSARVIAEAGAPAIATGSWSVAAAQGYADGEAMPAALVETVVARILAVIGELPLTVDVEGGYHEAPQQCADHVARLLDLGVVGINFEDRVVAGNGLYPAARQAERIAAIRQMATARGVPLFINARSDVFFQPGVVAAEQLPQALERARVYADAGASGFFVPGLTALELIRALVAGISLPVNVMVMPGLPPVDQLANAGVARISHGPGPWRSAMQALSVAAVSALAAGGRSG